MQAMVSEKVDYATLSEITCDGTVSAVKAKFNFLSRRNPSQCAEHIKHVQRKIQEWQRAKANHSRSEMQEIKESILIYCSLIQTI